MEASQIKTLPGSDQVKRRRKRRRKKGKRRLPSFNQEALEEKNPINMGRTRKEKKIIRPSVSPYNNVVMSKAEKSSKSSMQEPVNYKKRTRASKRRNMLRLASHGSHEIFKKKHQSTVVSDAEIDHFERKKKRKLDDVPPKERPNLEFLENAPITLPRSENHPKETVVEKNGRKKLIHLALQSENITEKPQKENLESSTDCRVERILLSGEETIKIGDMLHPTNKQGNPLKRTSSKLESIEPTAEISILIATTKKKRKKKKHKCNSTRSDEMAQKPLVEDGRCSSCQKNSNILEEGKTCLNAEVSTGNDYLLSEDVINCKESLELTLTDCHSEGTIPSSSTSHIRENVVSLHLVNKQDNPLEKVSLPLESASISRTRRKLLILDVNGLLVDIVSLPPPAYKPDKKIYGKSVFKRPFCDDFLKFCFEKFDIAIWSSRNRRNLVGMIDYLLGDTSSKLLFCWDQSKCTQTGFKTIEDKHKPIFLKKLEKVWDKDDPDLPWDKGEYTKSNTLLLDDSPYKALLNPPYTAIFPRSYTFRDKDDKSLGPGGDLRLYLEGLAMVEDIPQYVQEHPFGHNAITDSHPSWPFYLKVIRAEKSSAPTSYINYVNSCTDDGSALRI